MLRASPPRQVGHKIAQLLTRSWRESVVPLPPASELTAEELGVIWPLVVRSGAIGLLWRRTRAERPDCADSIEAIKQCYRQQVLDSRRYEQAAERVIGALQAAGIQPLLFKGWAIARHYPGPGLRSYTDIDIAVSAQEHHRAQSVIGQLSKLPINIDLHVGVPHSKGRDPAAIERRRRRAALGSVEVDVLGPEDHLRLLCLHMLIHGAWRTIWLCDIALVLEQSEQGFDWDYLLSGDRRDNAAVLRAIGLAHHLLGASLPQPVEHAKPLPRWLLDGVLEQWGRGYRPHPMMVELPKTPLALFRAARERWPNPIAATASLHAPYNDLPRLPFQITDYVLRTVKLLRKVSARRLQMYSF